MLFIKGIKISLRPLTEEDSRGPYLGWLNDPEINKLTSRGVYPYTEEMALEYIRSANNSKTTIVLAIIDNEFHRHVGNESLQNIDYINRSAEIGSMIGSKSYWGKGYAGEADKLMMEHAFNCLNLYRVYFGCIAGNIAVKKIAERLGMTLSGTNRHAAYKNGEYFDTWHFDILKPEWEKTK